MNRDDRARQRDSWVREESAGPESGVPCRRVVVAGTSRLAGVAAEQLLHGLPVTLSDRPDPALLDGAACVVLFTESVVDLVEGIRSIDYPDERLLVVAEDSNAVLRAMRQMGLIAQLIPVSSVRATLRPRVIEIARPHFLDRAVTKLAGSDLPKPVFEFVRQAWATAVPPSSVTRATDRLETSETTLRELWTAVGLSASPKEVLDWGMLGRAIALREIGAPWSAVADALSTNERRLRRIALRLLGVSLRELDDIGLSGVADRFQVWYSLHVAFPGTA